MRDAGRLAGATDAADGYDDPSLRCFAGDRFVAVDGAKPLRALFPLARTSVDGATLPSQTRVRLQPPCWRRSATCSSRGSSLKPTSSRSDPELFGAIGVH
jgi:hypothetical protein